MEEYYGNNSFWNSGVPKNTINGGAGTGRYGTQELNQDTKKFADNMRENVQAVGGDKTNVLDYLSGMDKQLQAQAFEMTLQERQWAYDHPAAQMARMKEAGINPNLAAGGIAGGNQSASAPSSPVSPGTVAEGIGNVAQGVASVANAGVGAYETLKKLPAELENIGADTDLKDSMKFLNDIEREGLKIDNKYKDRLNVSQLNLRNQQIKNMQKDWDLIDKRAKYVQKQLEYFDEQIEAELELTRKRSLEADKHSFQMEQLGNIAKLEAEFKEKYEFSMFSNADVTAFSLWKRGYDSGDFSEFEAFNNEYYKFLKNREFAVEKGKQEAITEEKFNQVWNETLAKLQVDSEFAPYYQSLEMAKEQFKALLEWVKPASGSGLSSAITNFIKAIVNCVNGQPYPNLREISPVPELSPKKPSSVGNRSFR